MSLAILPPERQTSRVHDLLLGGFLAYIFVGVHPLVDASASARVEGSLSDRLAVMGLFALALIVMARRPGRALACLIGNPGQIGIVGLALLSAFWSDFPDLTWRRALLLTFLTTITLALAVGVEDLRRFHSFVFAALTLIVAANLAACALLPSLAISDIGANGLYAQKNLAGIVAMIGIIVGFGWTLGASDLRSVARGALALSLIFAFLVLTRSKTSFGLTLVGVSLMAFFALAEYFGPRFILAAVSVLLLSGAALLAAFAAVDFDAHKALMATVSDASFTGRDQLWAFALNEAQKRYWWGHGYGAFWDVGYAHDPVLRVETGSWLASTDVGVINQAHNGYIEMWLELGLPAAIVAAMTIVQGAYAGFARAVLGAGSRQDRAALGALATLLALQVLHNFTEATLFIRGMTFSSVAALALFVIARPQHPLVVTAGRTTW